MRAKRNSVRRALQGGSYGSVAVNLRVAYRIKDRPVSQSRVYGFRFVVRGRAK